MSRSLIRLAAGATALVSTFAFAQLPGQFNTLPPPPDAQRVLNYQPGQQQSAPPSCPKLCPADRSPCDPIYMKETDGRCDGVSGNLSG